MNVQTDLCMVLYESFSFSASRFNLNRFYLTQKIPETYPDLGGQNGWDALSPLILLSICYYSSTFNYLWAPGRVSLVLPKAALSEIFVQSQEYSWLQVLSFSIPSWRPVKWDERNADLVCGILLQINPGCSELGYEIPRSISISFIYKLIAIKW